ncbi:MAG: APC family permease, partial [Armatimonadota bacterium]|nr:APC family permease [Armatimonadota bacterium]
APHRVAMCVGVIAFVAVANLRGVRESGVLFAIPTYLFIASFAALLGYGFQLYLHGALALPAAETPAVAAGSGAIGVFLLLHAFASGCAALTGIEAISNGVQAFKPPEARNAASTMVWMAAILATLFLGLTFLANALHVVPHHGETVVSQIARAVFQGGPMYYVIQAATSLILLLAANTSFAGFPRLAAMLARDRLLPRQFAHVGDRLVFSNGIVALALVASALVVFFHGNTHSLIPLYAVGVFLSFTLSQFGMVRRWLRNGNPLWHRNTLINLVGGCTTLVVLIVIAWMKFTHGAWMVVLLIPVLVWIFFRINAHYQTLRRQLTLEGWSRPAPPRHTVLVLVSGIHRGIVQALDFARLISADTRGVYVEVEPEVTRQFYQRWEQWAPDIPLLVLESPYRSLTEPVLQYIDAVQDGDPNHVVSVIIPEFVPARWWHHLLHNQSALFLKFVLLFRRGVIVTNVRYYLDA